MFIKKLIFFMGLILFLSGCEMKNNTKIEKEEINQKTTLENKQETRLPQKNEVELKGKNETTSQEVTLNDKIMSNDEEDKKVSKVQEAVPKLEEKSFTPKVQVDESSINNKSIPWSWLYSPRDSAELLSKYQGYAFGDTSKKIIYLTFDEGYENGYTSSILDTLRANNVRAAFFVTKPYVIGSFNGVSDSDLLKRMSKEGHIIANHSVQHKPMPTFKSEDAFNAELTGVEEAVNNIPGCKMSNYFRPPEGTFSELSLYYTQKLGYKSIFFAFAYQDYDVDKQPSPEAAKENILKNTRNGMICLLHAVSKTNASILDSLIKEWKNRGYEFKTLDEIPNH